MVAGDDPAVVFTDLQRELSAAHARIRAIQRQARTPGAVDDHPHGFSDQQFEAMFTTDTDVVFAFHGYPRAIHELLH